MDFSRPPYPAKPPVNTRDAVESLLKSTLELFIAGKLEYNLGLSGNYCINLLKHDTGIDTDHSSSSHRTDSFEGVPRYPLYTHIASKLFETITSGGFPKTYKRTGPIHEDNSLQHSEDAWNKMVTHKGAEILNLLKTFDFELHVQEPYFSQLKDGLKTIEGRCSVGDYNKIELGNLILFNGCLVLKVQDLHRYTSFSEMLEAEELAKILPGVQTIEEDCFFDGESKIKGHASFTGVQVYRKFYTQDKEKSNGVLGICFEKTADQPYAVMANIISGLGHEGIQRLLGLVHTVGTDPEALPPPRSVLLSSFMLPLKQNVQGNILTEGARTLAKHVSRSSNKYWGSFDGNESNKNRHALDTVNNLINHCCWLNLHIVPPHGVVFEMRDAQGYGARWSKDGEKFIGFVEPYMESGHAKGWKH